MNEMKLNQQSLIPVKLLKNLSIYWDEENREVVFERDKIFFTLKKGEFYPAQRAFTRIQQRGFYRRKK